MSAYYNEIDPFAAAWLRELISENLIAPGEVDERDIRDIVPSELRGFTQHHFFAGIGVWSYALRRAGWADDKPVWTGSCPCQPFSQAGKGKRFSDERHLWPAWDWLISQYRPHTIFGEQVASRDGLAWLDLVSSDLEAKDYACGAVNLPACGVGAPHIRQRTFFVANALSARRAARRPESGDRQITGSGVSRELGDPGGGGSGGNSGAVSREKSSSEKERKKLRRDANESVFTSALGDAYRSGRSGRSGERSDDGEKFKTAKRAGGPVNGFWADAEWIWCKDGKYRPVEPGTFPLAHGAPARVGRLRGYGNAINAEAATEFIKAYTKIKEGF